MDTIQCAVPGCKNTELIYSGIDAFIREIPFTEKYCYPCGNAFFYIKADITQLLETHEASQDSE